MGGPCRTEVGREACNNINNKDRPPIDDKVASKSLALYRKPVELYSQIRSRLEQRPVFLQRCLNYKIQALRQRRLKVTVQLKGLLNIPSLSKWYNRRGQMEPGPSTAATHQYLPVFVMVSSQPSPRKEFFLLGKEKDIKVAKVPLLDGGALSAPVTFLIPELTKLFELAKRGHLILFFAFTDPAELFNVDTRQMRDLDDCSGRVVWSKLSMASLCHQWLKNLNGSASPLGLNGVTVDSMCNLDFVQGMLQHRDTELGKMVYIQPFRELSSRSEMKLQVHAHAVEIGQANISDCTSNGNLHKRTPLASQAFRNPSGRVEFHYLYYFSRCEKTEVMEEFSCPFCLVRCYTFKVLFLSAAKHDISSPCLLGGCYILTSLYFGAYILLAQKILPNADGPIVNVTCRTDMRDPEGNIQELEPDLRTKNWMFWSCRPFSKIYGSRPKVLPLRGEGGYLPGPISQDHSHGVNSDPGKSSDDNSQRFQKQAMKGERRDERLVYGDAPGLSPLKRQRVEGRDSAEKEDFVPGVCPAASAAALDDIGLPLMTATSIRLRPEKNKQVAAERAEAKNRQLLQRRTFFHSHTAQPMALEELLSERDSEDELDEDLATVEDRRMLEDFVDVSTDEKEIMHMWNSFVRKQRVHADGHCSWACESFSMLHAAKFSSKPSLRRCFMLFLIKLWNHHLVDGATVDKCLTVVDSYKEATES